MLSLDPNTLAEEVRHAEEFRRKHTLRSRAIVQRFIGNWYRVDHIISATPENSVFAYVAFMLPNLWFNDASCRVQARRPQTHGAIAEAIESAIRCWQDETPFTEEGQAVIRDAMMGFGAFQVGIEPRDFPGDRMQEHGPGQQELVTPAMGLPSSANRPFAVRLSPEQLIIDPLCESPDHARFIGHAYSKDLQQVQDEALQGMWDADAVAKLTSVPRDVDETRLEKALLPGQTADRTRVSLVDLWIPERAMILTLARHNDATNFVLRATSYWGPPEGPYEIYGFYPVPGDPYPLSPLQPIMEQLEEMWSHQRQASSDAELYKRFIIVEESNVGLRTAIADAKSGGVYGVRGLTDYREIEMGGTPEGRLAHIEALRERADRTIGNSDAQRGLLQGKTATENTIVQGNVDTRTSFLRQRVTRSTEKVLRRVAWYFFFDDTIVMPVTVTDPFSGQVREGTFLGGIQPGQEGVQWVDFNLSIEPTSMAHTDDTQMQQRGQLMLQLAQEVGTMLVQMPYANWRLVTNTIGKGIGMPDLFDTLFSQPAIQQFMQIPAMFGYADPGSVALPGGVNPSIVAQGLGVPSGPPPQWGELPPGAAGGMASGGAAGFAPMAGGQGFPPMSFSGMRGRGSAGGGGAPMPFGPMGGGGRPGMRGGGGSPSPVRMGAPMQGNPRAQRMAANRPVASPFAAGRPTATNPRTQKKQHAAGAKPAGQRPMTGNPRAARKAAAAAAKPAVAP